MPVRPSLPYQGIARRAIKNAQNIEYDRDIDISAVILDQETPKTHKYTVIDRIKPAPEPKEDNK